MIEYIECRECGVLYPEKGLEMVQLLESEGELKPWTVVSRVQEENDDPSVLRVDVLNPLVCEGYVRLTAGGDLAVDCRRDFREDYDV